MKKILLTLFCLVSFMAINAEEATLSFANKTNRKTFSTTQQVWEQNGVVFTNDKSSSTNYVADYANPVRLYKSSKITVECTLGNISSIVFDCNSTSYATALKNSITNSNVSVSSDKVTVTLDGTSNNFVVNSLSAQVRMDALTVNYTVVEDGTPALTLETPSAFATVLNGTTTQTVAVTAKNLTSDITVSLIDNSGKFSINTTTLTSEGGDIEITYNGSSAGNATATLKVTCGDLSEEKEMSAITASHAGTKEDPLAVTDIVTLNSALAGSYWVIGTIGGYYSDNKYVSGAEEAENSNIALIENEANIPVQLPSGEIREALNLQDHADYVGAILKVYGSLETYFSRPGVKSVSDYDIDLTTTGVEEIAVENAPVEYYNLQGVKVARPENGIFIKKQGSRTSKVVL